MAHLIKVLTGLGGDFSPAFVYQALANTSSTLPGRSSTHFIAVSGTVRFDTLGTGFTYDAAGFPITGSYTKTTMTVNGVPIVEFNYSPGIGIPALNAALTAFGNSGFTNPSQLNTLFSGAPSTILGGVGNDVLYGLNNADTILGNAGNDILFGGAGNDTLNPGAAKLDANGFGFELSFGGAGNDIINIGSSGAAHYLVMYSSAHGGTLGINANLATNIVRDTFGNFDTINGVTFLVASDRNDIIVGDATNDFLAPGGGTDSINGGGGIDELDYYFIKQFNSDAFNFITGIIVNHTGDNAGTVRDPKFTFDTFTNIERIAGTRFVDTFNGSAFADSFIGGDGADTFIGGNGVDEVMYSQERVGGGLLGINVNLVLNRITDPYGKNDSVFQIETVTGTNVADIFNGNASFNIFNGLGGADFFNAGNGNDVLTGGTGPDTYLFNTILSNSGNRDTITDFVAIDDTMRLENAIFTALTVLGTLAPAAFKANATGVATDLDDRVIYNTATGVLSYDSDGIDPNTAVQFAILTTKPAISNADFVVV